MNNPWSGAVTLKAGDNGNIWATQNAWMLTDPQLAGFDRELEVELRGGDRGTIYFVPFRRSRDQRGWRPDPTCASHEVWGQLVLNRSDDNARDFVVRYRVGDYRR